LQKKKFQRATHKVAAVPEQQRTYMLLEEPLMQHFPSPSSGKKDTHQVATMPVQKRANVLLEERERLRCHCMVPLHERALVYHTPAGRAKVFRGWFDGQTVA